jgi:L-lactate dehydrogenase complex protein LldF
MNVCPVYERTGGHSYRSVYPGPIGAIITPQLLGPGEAKTLPFASTLCGACYDVCPVKINIPKILVHLRARENQAAGSTVERWTMRASVVALMPRGLRATAIIVRVLTPLIRTSPMQRLLAHLPVARAWQKYRDIPAPRFIRRGSK